MGKGYGSASPTLSWTRKQSQKYYKQEDRNMMNAWLASQASPEEQALMAQQLEAYKQNLSDRKATRSLILAQMGLKVEGDRLVPLTNEERKRIMTEAQKSRSSAAEAYTERANAALTGQTKLPSFLKKNIDYKKETEKAMLAEMLGPDYEKSTAAQQVVAEMTKKEEDIRQQLQDQDISVTPQMAQGLRGMLADEASQKIAGYEYLPRQNESLMRGRGSLLNDLQQGRLSRYKYALGKYEADRAEKQSYINAMASIFGAGGGMAAGKNWGSKKTQPGEIYTQNYTPSTNFGSTSSGDFGSMWGSENSGLLQRRYDLGGK